MKLQETTIMTNMVEVMRAKGLLWDRPNQSDLLFQSLFLSVSQFLGIHKKKDHKVALVVKDNYDNFKLAGIVQYHPNEEDDSNPGNYTYELTFDQADIAEIPEVYSIFDSMFQGVAQEVSLSYCNFRYVKNEQIIGFMTGCVEALTTWLDSNAKETEEVVVELEGYFQASVAVENGIKVFSIVPEGKIKQLIKGDSSIEK